MSTNEPESTAPKRRRWLLYAAGCVLLIVCAVTGWYFASGEGAGYIPTPLSFDNGSEQLKETAIVPTLDTPIPDGKSAIWCASFQLAWNRFKDDVAKEPIRLRNAEVVAKRLNEAEVSEADLSSAEFCAVAGLAKDGIAERIRTEMAQRFPHVPPPPELAMTPNGAAAYSYLQAAVKFTRPYFENRGDFRFKSFAGTETVATSFGLRGDERGPQTALKNQIGLLWLGNVREEGHSLTVTHFALDADIHSSPNQLVLARLTRQETLKATLRVLNEKLSEGMNGEYSWPFRGLDELLIPNMHWRIRHRFSELQGTDKNFLNTRLDHLHLDVAEQVIHFKLDRSGADLASESQMHAKSVSPRHFFFDQPFLLVMKKRTAKHPFFVMWVDNAELLQKR